MKVVDASSASNLRPLPFSVLAASIQERSDLRSAITDHYRAPEQECVAPLVQAATFPADVVERSHTIALTLVNVLRAKGTRCLAEGLMREYGLSSQEGVALMCLAEALLRIPDHDTRDALIRAKISTGNWRGHIGQSRSLFVNAATWALVVTGKITATNSDVGLTNALIRLIARGGEPLVRKGVEVAMQMMGKHFVTGQNIPEALANSRRMEAKGFRHSYDMLGEAAITAEDAARYYRDYEQAIHAIGKASGKRGIYDGPGISVKLSALHPRFSQLQRNRVMAELLPKLRMLALLARQYEIGFNVDAEESERLEISLDLLEALCFAPELCRWNGIGFAVQAYQKRAPFVLNWIVDLARRSGHRIMIRLVKGAYWDSEIKRAQIDGLEGFPVFTRKVHTDVSYLACARKLLAAPDAVFPQFATHNAYTVARIHSMGGQSFYAEQYEFQCLHGMGESLYEEVVGRNKLDRPCRIYAPVGTHETLLAYLVRRLLENGANSSFVNRIQDLTVPVTELVVDPVAQVASTRPSGAPHPQITLPRDMFLPVRANSAGLDLHNERYLTFLAAALVTNVARGWTAIPMLAVDTTANEMREVRNPADHRDLLGHVAETSAAQIDQAVNCAAEAAPIWQATEPKERAACMFRAADLMETRMPSLLGLIVREAGKSFPNAIAEVREAVDFLRYYGARVRDRFHNHSHRPLGPVVCISPWNFPLAIFTGQIAAALAAGNVVLAKPAEETPLIAAQAVTILRGAGVPAGALQFLPGSGRVGAQLVADPRTRAVIFTGSLEVARIIQQELARRLGPDDAPIPLIAETGGQNALIVDSSALPEQVVSDVLISAFDSAGQRCSALRVLCLQEDVANRILTMLRGALAELSIGNPDRLSTDVGPVITAKARDGILDHIQAMRKAGRVVYQNVLPNECAHGTFIPPTIIEIQSLSEMKQEVFGPVLHVLRFRRNGMNAMINAINATGYGLTFGMHTRIDDAVALASSQAQAGNIYVNRNMIGAVVGVQPFGGYGLSGTGPKAGGPLYLRRLLAISPAETGLPTGQTSDVARAWQNWLSRNEDEKAAASFAAMLAAAPFGVELEMTGPVGERNLYATKARGTVLCVATHRSELQRQIGAALATGNRVLVEAGALHSLPALPSSLSGWIKEVAEINAVAFDAVLFCGAVNTLQTLNRVMAVRDGPIVPVYVAGPDRRYPLEWLVRECSISINTTAAGGNTSLMMVG